MHRFFQLVDPLAGFRADGNHFGIFEKRPERGFRNFRRAPSSIISGSTRSALLITTIPERTAEQPAVCRTCSLVCGMMDSSGRDHEQDKIDASDPGQHILYKFFVPGTSTNPTCTSAKVEVGEPEVDRDAAKLFFF